VIAQLHVHLGDVTEAAAVRTLVKAIRPRAVLHLATHGAYEIQANARAILQTNILGTYNLLEASAEHGVAVFVNTGSSSEYGFKSEPMRETDMLEPNSYYAVAKAAQTHLCRFMAQRSAMGIAIFRLFSVYGPWEEPSRLIPTLIRRAQAGLPLEMASPDIARDFVFIDDILEVLLNLHAVERIRGEIINLGSGQETTLEQVVRTVLTLLGSTSEVRWGAMTARHWDSTRWASDCARAKALLDWQPRFSLAQGLAHMTDWMKARGDHYARKESRAAG
jgi:nucleoside-diphosphate-sugar epimerase